jgi:hypothetical protein
MDDKNALGDYVWAVIQSHTGLSMRQASIEAGLNENAIQQIVSGDRPHPRHDTLKAIADKWGTEHDYYEMCRLSGYPTPIPPNLEDDQEVAILTLFRSLSPEEKENLLRTLDAVKKRSGGKVLPIARQVGELDERGQRTILEMIEYVKKAQQEPAEN